MVGVGWFFINVDLAIFQPYLDSEAGDDQSLKIQVARRGIKPGPLAPQAKSLTTRPPLLPCAQMKIIHKHIVFPNFDFICFPYKKEAIFWYITYTK